MLAATLYLGSSKQSDTLQDQLAALHTDLEPLASHADSPRLREDRVVRADSHDAKRDSFQGKQCFALKELVWRGPFSPSNN